MELAVFFDEGHPGHEFYAGHTACEVILGSGVLQACGRMIVVRAGTVLLRRARPSRRPSQFDEVFLGDSWRALDPARLRTTSEESAIFCWLLTNVDMMTARTLHASIADEQTYLGCMAVNRAVRSQRALFRQSLPMRLRVVGNRCNLFFSSMSPDGRDNAVFDQIGLLGFDQVNWEDIGARDSIFDDFDTDDHFERLESLRTFLTMSLQTGADGADEILVLLEDLNPRLAATLGTAARSLMSAVSEEDRAHVGLTSRRYAEQLADGLYPPRDELVNGRDVSAPKVKNRVWAYITDSIGQGDTLAHDRIRQIGKDFDQVLEDANKVLHSAPTLDESRSLLTRLAMLTVTLLELAVDANRKPYTPARSFASASTDGDLRGAQLGDEHVYIRSECVARFRAHRGNERLGGVHQLAHRVCGTWRWCVANAANDKTTVGVGEIGEARQGYNEREAIGQGGIERFDAIVAAVCIAVLRVGWRIGGGPAIAQALDRDALDASLMDDGEEFVRDVGAAAADLVEERDFG